MIQAILACVLIAEAMLLWKGSIQQKTINAMSSRITILNERVDHLNAQLDDERGMHAGS